MKTIQGIAVSPGVAIGAALVIDNEGSHIPRRPIARDKVAEEMARLDPAFLAASEQISRNREEVAAQLGDQYAAIFSAQLQMLADPQLRERIEAVITEENLSPEFAVASVLEDYAKVFQNLENRYLAERAHDILDIQRRLLGNLLGQQREELSHLTSPVVVLAHNLTPGETAALDGNHVLGFVTEIGGPGGHTSIVAEARQIPAIVGGGSFLSEVVSGDPVIVDGDQGTLIIRPDEKTLKRFQNEARQHTELAQQLESLRDEPAETDDGTPVQLLANIEFPHEAEVAKERGALGVGLYRTEFLYLNAKTEPTEEDHYQAYRRVIDAMDGMPVVIRTLDLGADKMGHLPWTEDEKNPFLGLRSIRLSLRHLPLFRTQLRAILRASAHGTLRIMFPLISTLSELRHARSVLADVMEDLEEEEIPFDRHIPVGIMVEVPAAVMILDRLVKEIDFISIGTNDLVQYTLAVDRSNKEVATLYNSCDPAVLRLISRSINAARTGEVGVTLCGRMSGNPTYTMLLLGLGLRAFSLTPHATAELKQLCRKVTIAQCQEVSRRALEMDDAREIKTFLRQELRRAAPELIVHN